MSEKRNILVIMSDQHAPSVLGITNPIVHTPNLDALAREGVVFDNAYTPCPLCVPARMSFMTLRYPHEIGVLENTFSLNSQIPTFAHAAVVAGYETWLIGRMHFVGPDQLHGFGKHLVGDVTSQFIGKSMDLGPFIYNAGTQVAALQNSGAGITGLEYFDEEVTRAAVDALRDWKKRRAESAQTRPFFYTVGFYRPHSPFRAPREVFDLYEGHVRLPERSSLEAEPDYARRYHEVCRLHEANETQERRALTAYYALVTETDRRVGQVLRALEEIGEKNNTFVIYTSDHGEHAGQHHLWWKQSFYENSVGVPLIVRDPDEARGRRIAEPVSLMDVAATALDVCGAQPLPCSRAESLRPLLSKDGARRNAPVLSELAPSHVSVASRMVCKGKWKYIYYHDESISNELYDMQADPAERHNLIADPGSVSARDELHALLFEDGWNPESVATKAAEMNATAGVLSAWTKAVGPDEPAHFLSRIPVELNRSE